MKTVFSVLFPGWWDHEYSLLTHHSRFVAAELNEDIHVLGRHPIMGGGIYSKGAFPELIYPSPPKLCIADMGSSSGTGNDVGSPDQALSEVIGFVLILGIIVIFLALWMVYGVPAQGREAEIEHMNDVKNWFADYKFTLDSLWINNMEYERSGILVSSSMSLGTLGGSTEATGPFIPIFQPIGSSGSMQVRNFSEKLVITTSNTLKPPITIYPNSLEYSAENYYWIPQTYYYQMGGVFLNQPSGTVAVIAPEVSVYRIDNVTLGLRITPVSLINGSGMTGISGSSNVRVDSRLRTPVSYNTDGIYDWVTLTFTLRDATAAESWQNVLNEIRFEQGVPENYCSISRPGSPGNIVTMSILQNPDFKINLIVHPANYTVTVQPIGSVIS